MIIYLAGILSVAFLPTLKTALWAILFLPLLLFTRLRIHVVFYLCGVIVAASYGAWQLHHRLPLGLDRQDVTLSGYIVSLPEITDHRTRFILKVDQVETDVDALNRLRRIRINLYQFHKDTSLPSFRSGDYVTLKVRIRSPYFLQNPDAFDLERHFLSSGWDASGSLREVLEHYPSQHTFYSLRDQFRVFLTTQFAESEAQWLLPAIILGDRTAMTDEIWRVLQRTGTAHLLVVSGLHVAVISGSGFLIGRLLLSGLVLFGYQSTYLRAVPLLLAFFLATFYALLAGFNLPVQRAWIMVSVFLLGEWRLLSLTGWQRWRLALIVIMTYNPLAIIEPGAWMSFVAVAALLLMTDLYRGSRQSSWKSLLRAQWMIFIGLMPVMAWVFQQLGIIAPLINLLAIPLFSIFVMTLPILVSLILLEVNWVQMIVQQALELFWLALSGASEIQWATLSLTKPKMFLLLITLPLWFLLLIPLPFKWKLMGFICLLPIVFPREKTLKEGEFRAIAFDVGQGLAVLIETSDKLILYDTGPGYPMGGSAWGFAIAPWFKVRNQQQLTHLVISHNDLDHAGGLPALNEQLEVFQKDSGSAQLIQQGFTSCHTQAEWHYNQVQFRYLTDEPAQSSSENERSCVMEVRNDFCSLLLPGDAGHPTEYDLIRSGRIKSVDWLVAGHHGSASSSSEVFIDHLSPSAVIYTAGFANRYGHPAAVVTQRFRQRGIDEYNTATDGAVLLEAIKGQCKVSTQRTRKRRYWTNG
ncbi:MAG: DNA internalization-related competence protein ComEC/Rec2 [Oceanospirillales bacterium]|nr:MAG: DNA internalization-related competence protein ComEC/Rec2 [Oceanospirillales bacterium]